MWTWVAQAEVVLIRLCVRQEAGCCRGAASQEAADCITGGDRWRERWKRWIRELPGKHGQMTISPCLRLGVLSPTPGPPVTQTILNERFLPGLVSLVRSSEVTADAKRRKIPKLLLFSGSSAQLPVFVGLRRGLK